jgi:hypothetical protein
MAACLISKLLGPKKCGAGPGIAIGLGTVAGTIASVTLIGDAFDGTGTAIGTTIGFLVGAGVGAISATQVARATDRDVPIMLTFVLPVVAGAVIGYHLSADDKTAAVMRVPVLSLAF